MTTKLTPGERRALQAVKQGDVLRTYDAKGNRFTIHPGAATPRPSAVVLWRLEGWRMLITGPGGSRRVYRATCSVFLSAAGELALRTGERP